MQQANNRFAGVGNTLVKLVPAVARGFLLLSIGCLCQLRSGWTSQV
jgi:hypothetical protein